MLFATFLANALLLLTSFGTNVLINAPRIAEIVITFPPPVALISEDIDPLRAWRIVTPLIDQPSLRMALVTEKSCIEQELIAPFINVTPTLSTSMPIASCLAANRFSLCAGVNATENQNTAQQFLQTWLMITASASTRGQGLVVARDIMYSLAGTAVAAWNHFLDVLLFLFPSESVEAAATECPYWGLFLFWFYFLTRMYLPLVSVLVSVTLITQVAAYEYKTWKRLLLRLDDRPTLEALAPPSCKRVHFISEGTSPILSVHEYPRAFETSEDKAMLYWSFEEMKHFRKERNTEQKFRAKLKRVLAQKQKDRRRRKQAEWQLESQTIRKSDQATKRRVQDPLELVDNFDDRPTSEALAPPSCKHVRFISEGTSPILSVHEYPRAFETSEDKAMLYWSFEEMKRFRTERNAEQKFRAKLKRVLAQKQKDRRRRKQAEWQLESQLVDNFDDRPTSKALAPPSCKRVRFISEGTSPILSVHEYPCAFETSEDKAMLYWSFEEMGCFGMQYDAELKFRATLDQVLIQKHKDQQWREAEWWLESQMKWKSDRATRRRVEDRMEPERKRRRLN